MSSTRYAATSDGSEAAPERFLASAKLRGIQIGLNVITRIARIRTPRERSCMIWLHNYAQLENITADALSERLDLAKTEIRAALTDPEADLARFVRQVEKLRAEFEAALPSVYLTKPATILYEALTLAARKPSLIEVVGLTRMGKTIPTVNWMQRNAMDRAVFLKCPEDDSDRGFLFELARVLGIGTGSGKKVGWIRPQVRACFGKGMIEMIVVDEAHFLWPVKNTAKPRRIEFLRGLFDMHVPAQVSVVILATPQHTMNMNLALDEHNRWAPGQWDGRVIRYHFPDTMSDADLRGVAKHHAPDFSDGMIEGLILHAKATAGFCGAMVNAIELARFKAELRGAKKVTPDILIEAQQQMIAGTKVDQILKAERARTKKVVPIEARRAA